MDWNIYLWRGLQNCLFISFPTFFTLWEYCPVSKVHVVNVVNKVWLGLPPAVPQYKGHLWNNKSLCKNSAWIMFISGLSCFYSIHVLASVTPDNGKGCSGCKSWFIQRVIVAVGIRQQPNCEALPCVCCVCLNQILSSMHWMFKQDDIKWREFLMDCGHVMITWWMTCYLWPMESHSKNECLEILPLNTLTENTITGHHETMYTVYI